jgi:hypothetical protein
MEDGAALLVRRGHIGVGCKEEVDMLKVVAHHSPVECSEPFIVSLVEERPRVQ